MTRKERPRFTCSCTEQCVSALGHFVKKGSLVRGVRKRLGEVCGIACVIAVAAAALQLGYTLTIMALRLIAMLFILFTTLPRLVVSYCFGDRQSIVYGPLPQHTLDLYPARHHHRAPIVIYVPGGAWTAVHKAWGFLLGRALQQLGVTFLSVGYSNFAHGTVEEMVEDIDLAIGFVLQHQGTVFPGDSAAVYLMGQSVGAQVALMALLHRCAATPNQNGSNTVDAWSPRQLRGFIGVSGLFHISTASTHLHSKGLYPELVDTIMAHDTPRWSPAPLLRSHPLFSSEQVAAALPSVFLFHGALDSTIPVASSLELAYVLAELQAQCRPMVYADKGHTDMVLEDLLCGDARFLSDLMLVIQGEEVPVTLEAEAWPWMVSLARYVNPL